MYNWWYCIQSINKSCRWNTVSIVTNFYPVFIHIWIKNYKVFKKRLVHAALKLKFSRKSVDSRNGLIRIQWLTGRDKQKKKKSNFQKSKKYRLYRDSVTRKKTTFLALCIADNFKVKMEYFSKKKRNGIEIIVWTCYACKCFAIVFLSLISVHSFYFFFSSKRQRDRLLQF